jgi:hypothetical protein
MSACRPEPPILNIRLTVVTDPGDKARTGMHISFAALHGDQAMAMMVVVDQAAGHGGGAEGSVASTRRSGSGGLMRIGCRSPRGRFGARSSSALSWLSASSGGMAVGIDTTARYGRKCSIFGRSRYTACGSLRRILGQCWRSSGRSGSVDL